MRVSPVEHQLLANADAHSILQRSLEVLKGRIALISSFGAESALLLSMVADLDSSLPILFLETRRHFPETLEYRDHLVRVLGLSNVRSVAPEARQLELRDPENQLADFDPDACCALRKIEPMEIAAGSFDALVTGRKRSQAATRASLALFEITPTGQGRVNPLADWSHEQINEEMKRRQLPSHPLARLGFRSIGCAPCTRAVKSGENPRAGRWAGRSKTECGIHLPTIKGINV